MNVAESQRLGRLWSKLTFVSLKDGSDFGTKK